MHTFVLDLKLGSYKDYKTFRLICPPAPGRVISLALEDQIDQNICLTLLGEILWRMDNSDETIRV